MQFTLAAITALLSVTSAAAIDARTPLVRSLPANAVIPGKLVSRASSLCGSLSSPVCCDIDVLGVAALNCENVGTSATTTEEFESTCAASGKSAQCCVLSLGADSLLCTGA